jgi:hypothetical protein
MKREQKIVMRFQKHAERTAQSFEDERATRLSKFMLLGETKTSTKPEGERERGGLGVNIGFVPIQ